MNLFSTNALSQKGSSVPLQASTSQNPLIKCGFFACLPRELIEKIFSLLSTNEALKTQLVCKTLKTVIAELTVEGCLSLLLKKHKKQGSEKITAFLQTRLGKTNTRPLHLEISTYTTNLPSILSTIQKQFSIVSLTLCNVQDGETECLQNILLAVPKLQRLILKSCDLEAEKFVTLKFQPTLRKVSLKEAHIDKAGIEYLLDSCTDLRELDLQLCGQIPTSAFQLLKLPKELESFKLSGTKLDKVGLNHILASCQTLKKLSLGIGPWLDASAYKEAPFPSTLQALTLRVAAIDQLGIVHLGKRAPQLEKLKLIRCSKLERTDGSYQLLCKLKQLRISSQ